MMKHDKLLDVLHNTAAGLHQAGVMDLTTMREFDALCLPPVQDYNGMALKLLSLVDSKGLQALA